MTTIHPPKIRGLLAIHNAVANASHEPISHEQIIAALRGEGGHPSHLRAIFGDVSLASLASVGASANLTLADILRAYQAAQTSVAAANPELDRAIDDPW